MQKSLSPERALTPRLVRRETIQLSVIAALSVLALIFGPTVLRIVAAVVDIAAARLTGVASMVAWRAVGRSRAFAVYAVSLVAFAVLAIVNLVA